MIILYMLTGVIVGTVAATVTFFSGAGLGLALLAYVVGGTVGLLGSAIYSLLPRGPGGHPELSTTN